MGQAQRPAVNEPSRPVRMSTVRSPRAPASRGPRRAQVPVDCLDFRAGKRAGTDVEHGQFANEVVTRLRLIQLCPQPLRDEQIETRRNTRCTAVALCANHAFQRQHPLTSGAHASGAGWCLRTYR